LIDERVPWYTALEIVAQVYTLRAQKST
jgi:hypothetical protein